MTLSIGTRLGPYEVVSALGVGGMGEVYRARDSKLGRDVAIKVLLPAVANDRDRLARFEREARLLAALNHTNIAQIYGLDDGHAGDVGRFLVLEFVDGPTLADRIADGPIPVGEALPIARQIAEALEAAHDQGIVHRDLKPANIKVRPDGMVKVLDFGLAKASEVSGTGVDAPGGLTHSPTMTSPALMTGAGVLLGTAAYMAPEQAAGKPADRRSDIWAAGVVLFEMLTGRQVFKGETVSHVVASVLKDEPDWTSLPPDTPESIRRLLRRCLEKDRRRRAPDAADIRLEIDEVATHRQPIAARTAVRRDRVAWALVFLLAAALTATGSLAISARLAGPPVPPSPVRFTLAPPEGWTVPDVSSSGGASAPVAVAPDGERIAFIAKSPDGQDYIWIRDLDALAPSMLAGTEDASSVFWSPDSRSIGFFAGNALKRMEVSGGAISKICDAPPPNRGAAWGPDGTVIYALALGGLLEVPAAGGTPTPLTRLAEGETGHWRPAFLPDGRHFVYRAVGSGGPEGVSYIASKGSPERTRFLDADAVNVSFTQGHVLYVRQGRLVAQLLDSETMKTVGDPVPVADQLRLQGGIDTPLGVFSASTAGVIAYQKTATAAAAQLPVLTWLDRAGKKLAEFGGAGNYNDVQLSPDGTRAAVGLAAPGERTHQIWLLDLVRGVRTRLTFAAADHLAPVWMPDGSRLVFGALRGGRIDLFQKMASGAGLEEELPSTVGRSWPTSWSSDGRFLLFEGQEVSGGSSHLMVLPLAGDRKAFGFPDGDSTSRQGRFSPDGRWVAYTSNESGRSEVYVRSFPDRGGKWLVSNNGGRLPRWRGDGKELVYIDGAGRVTAAEVATQADSVQLGTTRPLFDLGRQLSSQRSTFDMTSDGQRFLAATAPDTTTSAEPFTVVLNWRGVDGHRP